MKTVFNYFLIFRLFLSKKNKPTQGLSAIKITNITKTLLYEKLMTLDFLNNRENLCAPTFYKPLLR